MGIRKEVLKVIREADVRGPRDTLARIEQLVNVKPPKVKRLIVTDKSCASHGFTPAEALFALRAATDSVAAAVAGAACDTCPDKEACKNGN